MSSFAAPSRAAQTTRVLCAADPERMFPPDESTRPRQLPTQGERAALAVCASCPVREACREAVLAMVLPYGVAGGLTAQQRRDVRVEHLQCARAAGAAA